MGHVLIELEKSNSTTALAKANITTVFSGCAVDAKYRFLHEMTIEDLNWCDSYLAVRPNSPMSLNLAKAIKESGRFYVTLFDDDLLNREGALTWRRNSTRRCIELSDLVVSPNPVLAEEYAQLTKTKRYVIFNTPVSEEEIIGTHAAGDKLRFVYAAGRDHAEFFEKLLKPVLNRFLETYANKVSFTYIGVEPDMTGIPFHEWFTFVPLMPLREYNEFMRKMQFDVGLAPLDDTSFSNRKYFNKYIEYTKVGIVGLYSSCLPFTLIVKDGENGFLIDNTQVAWLKALQQTVDERNSLEQCAVNAQSILRERFSVDSITDVIRTQIPEFESYATNSKVSWKNAPITAICFAFQDRAKKFTYQMRHSGIRGTVNLIRNFIDDRK